MVGVVVVVLSVVVMRMMLMMGGHPASPRQALRAEVAPVGGVPGVGVLAAGLQVAHLVGEGLVHHVSRGPAPGAPVEGRRSAPLCCGVVARCM